MGLIRRYSYILFSFLVAAAMLEWAYLSANPTVVLLVTLVVIAALIIYWVAARRGSLTPVNPEKRIRRGRTSDRPVVVHFYSDFDLITLFKRALVAGAEKVHRGHCDFIYVDINHPEGPRAAESQKAAVGDFVLYNATGDFVAITGMISVEKLNSLMKRPAESAK